MIENNRMTQMIGIINPLKQVIYYLTIGFVLSCFNLEQGYGSTIFSIASALCFYFGLRMIKGENKAFHFAYLLSVMTLINIAIISITKATYYDINVFIIIHKIIEILELLLCCLGLSYYLKNKKNIIFLAISCMIIKVGILMMNAGALSEIVFALTYIAIIFLLKKCEDDLELSSYQVQLSLIKIPSLYMTIVYFTLVMGLTISSVFASSYTQTDYEYKTKASRDYSYELLHESERTSPDEKVNMNVYDYDTEHYLFVYHFQWDKLQDDITSLNIRTNLDSDQEVSFVHVGNGQQDYNVIPENFIYGDVGILSNDKLPLSYYTYVNPQDDQLDIVVGYLAMKEKDTEYNTDLDFEIHTSHQYPYEKYHFEYTKSFSHTHFVENGEVIR